MPPMQPLGQSHKPAECQTRLYEVQRSMTLVGIDDRVWTVYGTMDTAFDGKNSQHSVEYHHRHWRKTGARLDPISRRMVPTVSHTAPIDIHDARTYFWAAFENWTADLEAEYRSILDHFKELLEKGYVQTFIWFPHSVPSLLRPHKLLAKGSDFTEMIETVTITTPSYRPFYLRTEFKIGPNGRATDAQKR